MLKISFVLAVLLVAKGLVSAQPVNGRAPTIIVARDVSNTTPSLTERLFNVVVDSLSGNHHSSGPSNPVSVPSPPSPSSGDDRSQDIDDRAFYENGFESRGLSDGEEFENKLKRRMMNDEYTELLARALYEGRLDARESPGYYHDGRVPPVSSDHGTYEHGTYGQSPEHGTYGQSPEHGTYGQSPEHGAHGQPPSAEYGTQHQSSGFETHQTSDHGTQLPPKTKKKFHQQIIHHLKNVDMAQVSDHVGRVANNQLTQTLVSAAINRNAGGVSGGGGGVSGGGGGEQTDGPV